MIYNLCLRIRNVKKISTTLTTMGAWVDSRSPFVYIRFLSFTGQRRIIHTCRSELWHRSKAKSSIKSCFGQNYECVYNVWCQTVVLNSWYLYFYPILRRPPLTETGDETLRNLETRFTDHPGQITPGEFTTHDTASSQSSHYNHLSNPSFMYCRTYVNLYDAVRSVIPCDKSHKHQFSFNTDGEQRASFGWDQEFQYGGNFSVSLDPKSTSGLLRNFLGLMVPSLR